MRTWNRWLGLLCGLLLMAPGSILAQGDNPYVLVGTLGSGGVVSGGGYESVGTISQVGVGESQGGGYSVVLGFWGGGEAAGAPRPDWADSANLVFCRR
ncbi:MAG: hypothetical protein IPK16_02930 [Anaerolineales bacterium]|nr:hypothetical protein [Anaerolineales bacterium]